MPHGGKGFENPGRGTDGWPHCAPAGDTRTDARSRPSSETTCLIGYPP